MTIRRTDLACQNLGVRITRRTQETQPDKLRPLCPDLVDNNSSRCFRISLIEHDAFVLCSFQHGGKCHNTDRWKAHHPNVAVGGTGRRRQCIELRIANVNQKYAHAAVVMWIGRWFTDRKNLVRLRISLLAHRMIYLKFHRASTMCAPDTTQVFDRTVRRDCLEIF